MSFSRLRRPNLACKEKKKEVKRELRGSKPQLFSGKIAKKPTLVSKLTFFLPETYKTEAKK
jgi:hypothetical protein